MSKTVPAIICLIIFTLIFGPLYSAAGSLSLSYSTYLGGEFSDEGHGIVLDSAGNAYVTGFTWSSNFPTQSPYQGTGDGSNYDVFVGKLSSSGNALSYSTYLGGVDHDYGYDIALDSSGNAYVTGYTLSSNFPTQSPYQGTGDGSNSDVFVSKLSSSGNALSYSTYLGGGGNDYSYHIALDSSGSAYVNGYTLSSNFPTRSPYQGTGDGSNSDVFVSKLSPSGSSLSYSTYLGGASNDQGRGIALDSSGNAYLTGETWSTDFPTRSPYMGTGGGNADVFVSKFSPSGSALSYSTYLGGASSDTGNDIALDSPGNAYVTGYTFSSNFPTSSPYQGTRNGTDSDVFVSKLSTSGTALAYSTYLGGGDFDYGNDIVLDSSGNAYVTGNIFSTNFPTKNPYQGTGDGIYYDVFISKLLPSGSALSYSTYLSGASDDFGKGIALDSSGNAYVTGYTSSYNFPTLSPYQGTGGGSFDAFIAMLRFIRSTVGVFRPSSARFYLRNSNSGGAADLIFAFGSTTDKPLSGNWDGDNETTIGVYRTSTRTFFLRNSNSAGSANLSFVFGGSGDTPIVGDWNGDGSTTIGTYRSSTRFFYLRNSNSGGGADLGFIFGGTGDTPIAGDWDGDGDVTAGVYRPSNRTFYLRNANSGGASDMSFVFGGSGDLPVVGDWDGDGDDSIGVFRPSNATFYLRNSNSGGGADLSFIFGSSSDLPIAGDWDGM